MPFDGTFQGGAPSTATALLHDAMKVIARPEDWTKGYLRHRWPNFFSPYRYCANGAILRAAELRGLHNNWHDRNLRPEVQRAVAFLTVVVRAQYAYPYVSAMNDHHATTHADVLHAFSEAIWLSEAAPDFASRAA